MASSLLQYTDLINDQSRRNPAPFARHCLAIYKSAIGLLADNEDADPEKTAFLVDAACYFEHGIKRHNIITKKWRWVDENLPNLIKRLAQLRTLELSKRYGRLVEAVCRQRNAKPPHDPSTDLNHSEQRGYWSKISEAVKAESSHWKAYHSGRNVPTSEFPVTRVLEKACHQLGLRFEDAMNSIKACAHGQDGRGSCIIPYLKPKGGSQLITMLAQDLLDLPLVMVDDQYHTIPLYEDVMRTIASVKFGIDQERYYDFATLSDGIGTCERATIVGTSWEKTGFKKPLLTRVLCQAANRYQQSLDMHLDGKGSRDGSWQTMSLLNQQIAAWDKIIGIRKLRNKTSFTDSMILEGTINKAPSSFWFTLTEDLID